MDDVLIFDNQPLPEGPGTITLDFFEGEIGEKSRGGIELPAMKTRMGKATWNPESCQIFAIPAVEPSSFQTLLVPDRTKWDLYLIDIPFTLHEAPDGGRYRELGFYVELTHPQTVAFDLFPKHVTTQVEETKTYMLSPQLKIQELDLSIGQFGRQFKFVSLRPVTTASGEGENFFYWKFRGVGDEGVIPETRHVLFVLQVPRGMASVDGFIHYTVDFTVPFLRGWRTKRGGSGSQMIHLNLHSVPSLPLMLSSQSESRHVIADKGQRQHFDICVICALGEEAEAFREEAVRQYGLTFQQEMSPRSYRYYRTTILNTGGEPLTLHLSWLPKHGPVEAGLHIKAVMEEFGPYFAAMTGICAGDRTATKPGDLAVAESAFSYDAGKVVMNEQNGQPEFLYDVEMWHPHPEVLQFAKGFSWPEVPGSFSGSVHIAPMAEGYAVRADNPFPRIRALVRKAVAIDMESAVFYRVLAEFPAIHALLVKGISDHADDRKDDRYHRLASASSAAYMLAFIKEYLSSRMLVLLRQQSSHRF